MSKLALVAVLLGGCSIAFEGGARKSLAPALADTAVAAGALALGISESEVTCSDSQWLCLSNIDHTVGAVSIGVAAFFALSALYGYTHTPSGAETPASEPVDHASIAAHAGDCTSAASLAMEVHARDEAAYQHLLADEVVQSCLLRGTDPQRRAALDGIAHAPGMIPLAANGK